MSKNRVRVMTLLLTLLLPILAACGGGAAEETEVEPVASVPVVVESPASSMEVAEESPEASMESSEEAEASMEASMEASPEADMSAPATDATAAADAGATLNFDALEVEEGAQLRFSAAGNTTEQQLYQDAADRFNELFADQNVTLTFEPVPSEYETTITAGFAGGNAPDVFLLNGQLMGQLAPEGVLLPLDDTLETIGRSPDDFYTQLLELYQRDGQTYGLPKDFNPLVLFINTDIAEQAGVDPASIETWDDLQQAAQTIADAGVGSVISPICFDPNILRFAPFFFQSGNPIIENGEAVFNQESGIEAIQYWKDLQSNGLAQTYQEIGTGWCGEAFAQQASAMVVEGGWLVPFMADPQQGGQDINYTAVQLPQPEGGEEGTILFTNAFAANNNTEYPNAAAAAVAFLTSETNQRELIQTGLAQPSLRVLADDPYFETNTVAETLVQAAEGGRVAETVFGGPERQADVLRTINQSGIEQIFIGNADVQESLDAAAEQVNGILGQ